MFTNFIIPAYTVFYEDWNQKTITEVTAPKSYTSTNSIISAYSFASFVEATSGRPRAADRRPYMGIHCACLFVRYFSIGKITCQ